jgi:hypothetical protein
MLVSKFRFHFFKRLSGMIILKKKLKKAQGMKSLQKSTGSKKNINNI